MLAAAAGKAIVDVVGVEAGGGPRHGLPDDLVLSRGLTPASLRAALVGRVVTGAGRKGKLMWWHLSGAGPSPTFHLGMTGSWAVRAPAGATTGASYRRLTVDVSSWPPRFTKAEFVLADGTRLAFVDPRRLARVALEAGDPAAAPAVASLAPDALTDAGALSPAVFAAALAGRTVTVKALLLDQCGVVSGVGNWIADEVLYQAGVHPESPACALPPAVAERLRATLLRVVATAVGVNADSAKFPPDWLFHVRWGKGKGAAVVDAAGRAVTFVTVGGRTSAVVRDVQGAPLRLQSGGGEKGKAGAKGKAGVKGAGKGDAGGSEAAAPAPVAPPPRAVKRKRGERQ